MSAVCLSVCLCSLFVSVSVYLRHGYSQIGQEVFYIKPIKMSAVCLSV